jgi:hypothetical protein
MESEKNTPAVTGETLEAEELAGVQGGFDLYTPARLSPSYRLDLAQLRSRFADLGNTASHVKDSGPTWVNSPRYFDVGSIVSRLAR